MIVSNTGDLIFIDEITNEDNCLNILHSNLLSFVILELLCQKDQGFKFITVHIVKRMLNNISRLCITSKIAKANPVENLCVEIKLSKNSNSYKLLKLNCYYCYSYNYFRHLFKI